MVNSYISGPRSGRIEGFLNFQLPFPGLWTMGCLFALGTETAQQLVRYANLCNIRIAVATLQTYF